MATYDYEKIKKQYDSMTDQQKQQFADMNKNDTSGNYQKFMNQYNAEKNQANSTPKTTGSTVSNNTVSNAKYGQPTEYQPNPSGTNKSNSYVNQGQGNYAYDTTTQYYEKQGSNNQTSNASSSIRDKWDNMDYDQQQEFLKNNPNAKSGIIKAGGTIKQSPYENQGEGKYEYNPNTKYYEKVGGQGGNQGGNQGGWDYQDNSPERMQQMANNLNDLYQTDPGLFANEDTFRKFFIDGKGRTPEQEQFLIDYYKNMQTYNKFDGYSADALGSMYAYGKVPEIYLNYVKTSNPDRYAAIMDAKDREQDKISNKSYYNTQLEQAGFESSDTTNLAWQKKEGLLVDENNDLIDDRRYHEPSEEERTMVNRANEIIARRLEIKNIRKNLERDYTKAYPGATKATIVALVNDAMSELQAEDDDLAVELAQLQGQITYEQNERQQMDAAGADTITQLQKNLGMYYQYTPEGMSELAQAQYAATNVTLDQADNGTDTQKQMALESVLSPIYEQYADIIQRPMAQVINDVMAYAKNNGVGLSEALEQNFMKYLREKPEYQNRINAKQTPEVTRIGTDSDGNPIYGYWDGNKFVQTGYSYNGDGTFSQGGGAGGAGGNLTDRGTRQNSMREIANNSGNLEDAAKNIATAMEGTELGLNTCGVYVNDYIYGVTGEKGPFGSLISEKTVDDKGLDNAKIGDAIVFDWNINPPSWADADLKKYGHVGIITGRNPDGSLQISSTINGKVTTKTIKPGDDWYSNIKGTKHITYKAGADAYGYGENPMSEQISLMRKSGDLNADQKKDLLFASQAYGIMYDLASSGDIEHLLRSGEGQKFLANLRNAKFVQNGEDATGGQVMEALKNGITDQRNLKTVNDLISVIELKLRKTSGAAIAASERVSNFDMLLPSVNQEYDVSKHKYERFENTYLREYFNSAGAGIDGYKYIDLFGPNSPYYKTEEKDNIVGRINKIKQNLAEQKGTWDIGAGAVVTTPQGQYDDLFNFVLG